MIVLISIIIFVLVMTSGVSKAIMDTLAFHFYASDFSKLGSWWGPNRSWENKYTWSRKNKVLRWLLSSPLVWVTDAWHFFQAVFSVTFAASFVIGGIFLPWWVCFITYVGHRLIFHIFFTWVFTKK